MTAATADRATMAWGTLAALAAAQFVMVLDQAVMNVSISQLVEDFDTTVTTIQAVITLYCLVMAMLMLTGGKIGDIIGRRRAFVIGLVIYACGSAPDGRGADGRRSWLSAGRCWRASVLRSCSRPWPRSSPATSRARSGSIAYAVIGGVAGAGIAVGPILGGWATTELTWRVVFAGRGRARGRHPRHDPAGGRRPA